MASDTLLLILKTADQVGCYHECLKNLLNDKKTIVFHAKMKMALKANRAETANLRLFMIHS